MRALVLNEIEATSGGNNAIGAIVVGTIAVAAITAYYSSGPSCYPVDVTFTTVTPVFDPLTGYYLGDQIDTYVKQEIVCS